MDKIQNLTQSLFLELTMLKLTKAIIIKDGKKLKSGTKLKVMEGLE
ncbi:hypothetical protein [Campylobacter iguaniorum]|nr:hypothetical protein [Campylobacter iguaniorum]